MSPKETAARYEPRNRASLRASDHDGEIFGDNAMVVQFMRENLHKLDLSRWLVIYIRKSEKAGDRRRSNYLKKQEDLYPIALAAGIDPTVIKVLDEDIGISGIYDENFRPSLKQFENWITTPKLVGTLLIEDISRVWRDPSLRGPVNMANELHICNAKIVTLDDGIPRILDMGNSESDRQWFIDKARAAAMYRKELRARLCKAREKSFLSGNWSGRPVPIGWRVIPPSTTTILGRNVTSSPKLTLYEPHREVRMRVMRLADNDFVKNEAQLIRMIREQNIVIPPFEEEFRDYMQARSILKAVGRMNPDGSYTRYSPDEPFEISIYMLYNLLTEPLSVGALMYGSGPIAGRKKLEKEIRKHEKMHRPHDSWVRDYQDYAGTDPSLAACRTEEEVELFWRLQEKFCVWDPEVLRASNFTQYVANPGRPKKVKSGRPPSDGPSSPYSGIVWCLKHGQDENKEFILSHHMTLSPRENGGFWECRKDLHHGVITTPCSHLGGTNLLGKILDDHFRRRAFAMLKLSMKALMANDDVPSIQEQIKNKQAVLNSQERSIKRHYDTLNTLVESWEEHYDEEEIQKQKKEYIADHIDPLQMARKQILSQIKNLEQEANGSPYLRCDLQAMFPMFEQMILTDEWDRLENKYKQRIIAQLIKWVGVWIGGPEATDDVLIIVDWHCGVRDTLISWRLPPRDNRPWEAFEDQAIKELWPSGCSISDMQASLLPGRRYHAVNRRAKSLGIVNPGRVTAWRERYKKTHKSYGELNTNAVYFAQYGQEDSDSSNWIEIVHKGIDLKHSRLPLSIQEALTTHCPFQVLDILIQGSSGRPLNKNIDNLISKETEFELLTLFQRLHNLEKTLRSM